MKQIKDLKVYISSSKGDSLDITKLVTNIKVKESILSDLSGQVEMEDSKGVLDNAIGTSKTITVSFKYLENTYLNRFYLDGASFVDLSASTKNKTYAINLQSVHNAVNAMTLVKRSYKGLSTDIIVKIYDEFFGKGNITVGGDSLTQGKYIVPNISPKMAINVIKKNAYDEKKSPFVLFQRFNGGGKSLLASVNWLAENQFIEGYTIKPTLPSGEMNDKPLSDIGVSQTLNIQSDHAGYLQKISAGVFGKTINEVDLNNSSIKVEDFGMNKDSFAMTVPFLSDKYSEGQTALLNEGLDKDTQKSISFFQSLNGIVIKSTKTVAVPGLSCGHVIGVEISTNTAKNTGKSVKFTGAYLVTEMTHHIKDNVYTQDITLMKR